MKDTIYRQDAIDRINKQREHLHPDVFPQDAIGDAAYRICAEFIERLPSAERVGKWISDWNRKIKMIDGCPDGSCHCSNCGEWLVASDEYLVKGIYCPNCGARMVSEDDIEAQRDYEAAVEQMEHDILYEPTYSQEDGSM